MNRFFDILHEHGFIFRSTQKIDVKTLGSRKKLHLWLGVDLNGYYTDIMWLNKRSRVLVKEAAIIEQLHERLEKHIGATIKGRIIVIEAPLCSKAKKYFYELGWQVVHREIDDV